MQLTLKGLGGAIYAAASISYLDSIEFTSNKAKVLAVNYFACAPSLPHELFVCLCLHIMQYQNSGWWGSLATEHPDAWQGCAVSE
jgi:hypothetical protein